MSEMVDARCNACGHGFQETEESLAWPHDPRCPKCGSLRVQHVDVAKAAEQARTRVYDDYREMLFNGPGVTGVGEECEELTLRIFDDAYVLTQYADQLKGRKL